MDRRHVNEMSGCHDHDLIVTCYSRYWSVMTSPHSLKAMSKPALYMPQSTYTRVYKETSFTSKLEFCHKWRISMRVNVFHFTRNTQILLAWHIVLKMPPTQLSTYNNTYDIHTHKQLTPTANSHSYDTRTKSETRHPLQRQEARAQQRERSFRRCQRNVWKWNRADDVFEHSYHFAFHIVVSLFKKSYNYCNNSL